MRNLVFICLALTCGIPSFGDSIRDEFNQALSNNQFAICAQCIVKSYDSYDSFTEGTKQSPQSKELTQLMIEKWITTDEQLDFYTFKIMTRLLYLRYDLVKQILDKPTVSQDQKELALYFTENLDRIGNSEHRELIHKHLQDKCVCDDFWPLAVKYRLAYNYWPNELYLISYDKNLFQKETNRASTFFHYMILPDMYASSPLFIKMAENYLSICSTNSERIVSIIKRLDESTNETTKYREKYFVKFSGNFKVQLELAISLDSEDKVIDLLKVNDKEVLSESQFGQVIDMFTYVDEEYRKEEVKLVLESLKKVHSNLSGGNWTYLISNLQKLIDLRSN